MLAGPYPNTLKRVAYSLVSVQECVDKSSHLPLYASGDRPVYAQVGNVAAEAVNYFDGDGGSIHVDRFPGLRRYLRVVFPFTPCAIPGVIWCTSGRPSTTPLSWVTNTQCLSWKMAPSRGRAMHFPRPWSSLSVISPWFMPGVR